MKRFVIIGGGAAGFFGAIACARRAEELGQKAKKEAEVIVLEKGGEFLTKVRISGGGRCNVTHSCFDPRALTKRYPRGERALIAPFHRFQPTDTVAWFEARGVRLKTESDGRMFPVTDSSQTIIDCLTREAADAGVKLYSRQGVERIARRESGGFDLTLSNGETLSCDRLLLATGGYRGGGANDLVAQLGHPVEPPVPSLFTFHIEVPWLRELAGVSAEAEASIPGTPLREQGPLLVTHWGVSGPAILRLSAWGARILHGLNYRFPLLINWLPKLTRDAVATELRARRDAQPAALVANTPLRPLTNRLWEKLVLAAGISAETRWATLPRASLDRLAQQINRTEFDVTGKSTHKAEFVTCGGIRLPDVDFKTMESRLVPGLHFSGEVLDIDGITGGFNFQAAWTTGWIAGRNMAESVFS